MGQLRDRMEGDLLLKGLAEVTRAEYLRCATQLAAHYRRSPAELGADEVHAYLVHLVDTLHYSPANLKMHVAALKFLYTVTPRAAAARNPRPTPDHMARSPSVDHCHAWLSRAASPRCARHPQCAPDSALAGPAQRAHAQDRFTRRSAGLTLSQLHAPSATPISA